MQLLAAQLLHPSSGQGALRRHSHATSAAAAAGGLHFGHGQQPNQPACGNLANEVASTVAWKRPSSPLDGAASSLARQGSFALMRPGSGGHSGVNDRSRDIQRDRKTDAQAGQPLAASAPNLALAEGQRPLHFCSPKLQKRASRFPWHPEAAFGSQADLEEAIRLNPGVPTSWRNRSLARLAAGDWDGALADVAEVQRLGDMTERDWRTSAEAKLGNLDYKGTIADCDRAIKHDPWRGASWRFRGRAKLQICEYTEAERDLSQALRMDALCTEDWAHRAHARLRLGDASAAFLDCNEAIRQNPNLADAWCFRAEARLRRGDLEGCVKDSSKCIRLNKKCGDVWGHRATAKLQIGDYDGAIADSTEALRLNPTTVTLLVNRSEAKHAKGDLTGCLADCEEAVRIDDINRAAKAARGRMPAKTRDAVAETQEAVAMKKARSKAFYLHGKSKLEKGHYADSINDETEALRIDPYFTDAKRVRDVALDSQRIIKVWTVPMIQQLGENQPSGMEATSQPPPSGSVSGHLRDSTVLALGI